MSEQSSHTATTLSGDFDPEQKRYLEGFMSGLQIGRPPPRAPSSPAAPGSAALPAIAAEPTGPNAAHLRAQDRFLQEGKKLSDPEKFKRELHPFDAYEKLKEQAVNNEAPKAADNFRWRFYGLFYCAPNQTAYMCRLRIPNGILNHWQLAGVGDLADRYAGGYAHVTTRANLQMREVEPKNAVALLEAIQDLGLCSRGSGADNIRNVTGTPTAGIDRQELIDTRPYARDGISTSSTTARFTACRGSSTWVLMEAASFRYWKIPTTSGFRRSQFGMVSTSSRESGSGCCWGASQDTGTSRATPGS